MTHNEAIDVAIANAITAIDQINEPTLRDAIASYRENVIDTLSETGSSEYEAQALAAFDAKIEELRPTTATLNHCAEVYAVLYVPRKGRTQIEGIYPDATLAWDHADAMNARRDPAETGLYTVEPAKFFTRKIGA